MIYSYNIQQLPGATVPWVGCCSQENRGYGTGTQSSLPLSLSCLWGVYWNMCGFKCLSSIFFVCIVILVNQFTTLQQDNTNEMYIYCKCIKTNSTRQLETGALHQLMFQRRTSTSMTRSWVRSTAWNERNKPWCPCDITVTGPKEDSSKNLYYCMSAAITYLIL